MHYCLKFLTNIVIVNLLFFTNPIGNDIISNYKALNNSGSKFVEIRKYSDRFETRFILVDFIEVFNVGDNYAKRIATVQFSKNTYNIKFIVLYDYAGERYKMFDKDKKTRINMPLDKESILANKQSNIRKIKRNTYFENRYLLPYLGEKYLNQLIPDKSRKIFSNNNINARIEHSSVLVPGFPINAKITISSENIIEEYENEYKSKVIRIL